DASPVGRVHLVARERDEVEVARVVRGPDVDAAVRRELGRVDGHQGAVAVRELCDLVDGGDETGDIGRSTDGDQADLACAVSQRALDSFEVDVALRGEADHEVAA